MATIANGSEEKLRTLIARQKPGFSLAETFYSDPDIYARDLERLLMRHWLVAGHESSVEKPGDYVLVEIAGESVIIVRGQDSVVRAHANVCRHRGSRVCREAKGNAKVFVCPYHAWAYNLDGTLRSARHMPEDFDATAHGLKPVHLRVIEGLILISFAQHPLGLGTIEATMRDCIRPYGWTKARVAHREIYPIEANWKLSVENYLECYHCAPAHPEYSKLHALEQPWPKIQALKVAMDARGTALGFRADEHSHWQQSSTGEEAVHGFRYPLHDGMVTGSADGKPVAPLMGGLNGYDGGVTSVHLGPASFFIAYPDHGVIYRFFPVTIGTSALEVIWIVDRDAKEGVDYDRDALTWLWHVTSGADKRIIEDNQKGVASRYYEPGPFAPMEYNERRWVEWYLAEMA
ncbi:MAG: aromatic ring-hydroxylating dioxygenase subunit alpha [Alphaproteobacteria bacterium]